MAFIKRYFLFFLTNVLVIGMLYLLFSVLSAFIPALRQHGISSLLTLSTVLGFGGAFLSLALSKWMAKRSQGVQVIDPVTATGDARWLVDTVHRLAHDAGIVEMPEVGYWESDEINAFCTGPNKDNALVAVSSGILRRMSRPELEGVLGHEISHAANGDMVTMALIQGVVNTFVFLISFLVTNLLANALSGNRENRNERPGLMDFFLRQFIFNVVQTAIGLAAFLVVIGPFSRHREFRADAGGARLTGRNKMISALAALQDGARLPQAGAEPSLAAAKISGTGPASLFSTHPSLEARMEALRQLPL